MRAFTVACVTLASIVSGACGDGIHSFDPTIIGAAGRGGKEDAGGLPVADATVSIDADSDGDTTPTTDGPVSRRVFSANMPGTVSYDGAVFTVISGTFDVMVTLTIGPASAPRSGPVGGTYQVALEPTGARTHRNARFSLALADAQEAHANDFALAYYKPKPEPPGLWIACQNQEHRAADHLLEGDSPGFDTGVETFALLARCSTNVTCGQLACVSGMCQ